MLKLKRCLIFAVAAVQIILFSGVCTLAVDVDGICGNAEWRESAVFDLNEQKIFGNEIKSAVVKTLDGEKYGCVYLAIFQEFEKNGDINDGMVRLRINDGEDIFITVSDGVTESAGYEIEAVSDYDQLTYCAVTEVAIHLRDGVKPSDEFKINLFDLNGRESNTFTVNFPQAEDEPVENSEATEKTSKTKTSRTTKYKTTKYKTTKKASSRRKATTKAFNYKKVDKNKYADDYENEDEYYYNENAPQLIKAESKAPSQNMKYVYVIAGTVCAMGVAVAAVVSAMKSADSKDKK